MCVHPYAAWRILPPSGRSLMLAAYAALGYSITLVVLVFA
jgi:hypothetical protein